MFVLDAGILGFNLTLVLQLVIFIVTAVILWKLAWGPLTAILEARELRIEAGLKAAAESEARLMAVQAEMERSLERARVQAREIIARAQREAAAEAQENRTRARHDADVVVARAQADIGVERDRAIQELRDQVGALVVAAAGKILGAAIDENAHRRLIDESLARVGGSGGGHN